ncbi:SsrA-binding protein SmpB [Candidatus Parcubacteria bacterium]|jgi:SsrA-binding protein|nr:SsrA-binding protein SmpB [Candidatus Parcubacteria bacterium]
MSILAKNKRAGYEYKIVEEFVAGLVLTGHEVKSVKQSHLSLKGSFVSIKDNQAWIKKMYISPYQKASFSSLKDYNPERDRKLLLSKKEIHYLQGKTNEKGLTMIPLSVYTTRRLIKVKIALVKGKRKFDKRQDIKKRDIKRRIISKIQSF